MASLYIVAVAVVVIVSSFFDVYFYIGLAVADAICVLVVLQFYSLSPSFSIVNVVKNDSL